MSGKLYVVGTPIGNLGDFSPRAVETLDAVDFIAAEDTRVTLKLLNHFGIKKEMISYFEHNKNSKGDVIVSRLLGGENCAICTDAGMPAISDPGEDLVRECIENGIDVFIFLTGKIKGYTLEFYISVSSILCINVDGSISVDVLLQPVIAHIFIEICHQLVIESLHKLIENILTEASVGVRHGSQ